MTGYELLTEEQRKEVDNLREKLTHSNTMRFTDLDGYTLAGYNLLMHNLEVERSKEQC